MTPRALLFAVAMLAAAPLATSYAQDGPPPAADAAVIATPPGAPIVAPALPTVQPPSAQDTLQAVNNALSAARGTTAQHMAIAALIAILLRYLLMALEALMGMNRETKVILPWVCSGLGVLLAVITRYAAGSSWIDSVIIGGAGPGAVLWNEVLNAVKVKLGSGAVKAALLLVGFGLVMPACAKCKDPANANLPECQLQQKSINCAEVAGIDFAEGAASNVWSLIVTGGANYMAELVQLGVKLGVNGTQYVACEVQAIDAYFTALAGGQPPPAHVKAALAKAGVATEDLPTIAARVHARAAAVKGHPAFSQYRPTHVDAMPVIPAPAVAP